MAIPADLGGCVLRLAIAGLGPSHDLVPWEEWETWGLPWDPWFPRYSTGFEMHDRSLWKLRGDDYESRLKDSDVPVYMQKVHEDIPRSRAYPLGWVTGLTGDYFGSSLAYMLALAIADRRTEIGLWGYELKAEDGYDHQRPNVEYLLGFARARGIRVYVAPGSDLLSHRQNHKFENRDVTYPERYGYL